MGLKYIVSQKYSDSELGTIHLRVLSTAVRYSARWKADGLHITVPPRVTVAEYGRVIDSWRPKLAAIRPAAAVPRYSPGFSFSAGDWSFEIRAVDGWRRGYVGWEKTLCDGLPLYIIKVSPLDDLSAPSLERTIGRTLMHVASLVAPQLLLESARREAERLGLAGKVKSWTIGRGKRRMGCCKASGEISLSAILMFFPPEMRRSTITHELAHLTHFDHSPAFHTLWQKYLGHSTRLHRPAPSKAPLPI